MGPMVSCPLAFAIAFAQTKHEWCVGAAERSGPLFRVVIEDWFGEGPEPLPLETPAQVKQFATRPR